jgi:tetratricopeptide (TPR) repeat protein
MTNQPAGSGTPKSADDYLQLGWYQHAKDKLHAAAEESFRQAAVLKPNMVEAHYGLGLALKALGRPQEASVEFQKVVDLIESGGIDDPTRSAILRRMAIGHINQMRSGDWNLEKELWQRKE